MGKTFCFTNDLYCWNQNWFVTIHFQRAFWKRPSYKWFVSHRKTPSVPINIKWCKVCFLNQVRFMTWHSDFFGVMYNYFSLYTSYDSVNESQLPLFLQALAIKHKTCGETPALKTCVFLNCLPENAIPSNSSMLNLHFYSIFLSSLYIVTHCILTCHSKC